MTTSTEQLLREALKALEHAEKDVADFQRLNTDETSAAIKSLRQALTQPAQAGEAVASIYITPGGAREFDDWKCDLPVGRTVLYTTPPASQEQAPSDSLTIAMASVIGLASALHRVKAGNTDGAIEVITKVRNHLIAHGRWLASQEQAQQPSEPHLFEFWWEAHMPQSTQAEAWAAWQAAPSSKGVGIGQQPSGGEVVAWRTCDGEGGYDYRTFEGNENYADEWAKRLPQHKGWVEPLTLATKPEPMTEHQRGSLVMEHLGPAALAGGQMSPLDAFTLGIEATERFYGITITSTSTKEQA